jgi:ATP-dependent Clp protease ATP-binding subunit ClpC
MAGAQRDKPTKATKLAPLELETLLTVRDHGGGLWTAAPLAASEQLAIGGEVHTLTEQRMFIEALLADAPPELCGRYAAPRDAELHEVDVRLPLDKLPRRLQLPGPVTFCCVVLTHRKERWVVVPSLGHTFFVGPDDQLEQRVADEVRRIVGARTPSPSELMALLPAEEERLERLELSIERDKQLVPGRAKALRKRLTRAKRREQALAILESVATPLSAAELQRDPPLCGRERELEQLSALLGAKERLSVMLVAKELSGKSALVRGWIQSQHHRQGVRDARPVFATSGARLIAGMSGLGQWQERVRRVLEAAELLDAVLYVETLADIFSDHPEGKVDIAAALRPWLDEGRVRLVAEARPEQLDRYEARHAGFVACLQRLPLGPSAPEDSLLVLQSRAAHHQRCEPHRPQVEQDALQPLCDLVDRYQPHASHPGKAVRLYEQLRASAEELGGLPAREVRLGRRELYQTFSLATGIPELLLREDRGLDVEQVVAALRRRVVGQGDAVRRVAETVCVIKARLAPPDKPLATFLFAGPTGVGKTELARALAGYLFGSDKRLTRFDMSEYMDADAAERLIRGSNRGEGALTRKVRQQPFCVLLLDEIEKAHSAVFDLLLQVLGEGRLTDAAGRTASFVNAMIIMTSNLGARHREHAPGLVADPKAREGRYLQTIERAFRPELINRIDRIVRFSSLTPPEIEAIAQLTIERISARHGLAERRIGLQLSAEALAELARRGYAEAYGARQLSRCLEDQLVTPLAKLLAGHLDADGGVVSVRLAGEADSGPVSSPTGAAAPAPQATLDAAGLVLTLTRGRARRRRSELRGLSDICELRRDIDRLLHLDRAQQVREQIDYLVAQLASAEELKRKQRKRRKQSARAAARERREHTEVLTAHKRLSELWQAVERPRDDLLAAEELAMGALAEREDASAYLGEALDAERRFQRALCYVLVALRPQRDQVTLLAQEIEGLGGFDCWLTPLLGQLGPRRWTLTAHGRGVAADPRADDWQVGERGGWGPPRDASWLEAALERDKRPFRSVLLRLRGPYVGCLLALEAGLHIWEKQAKQPEARLVVRHIAQRTELVDEEWTALAPANPAEFARLRREAARRRFPHPAGPCRLAADLAVDLPQRAYWSRFEEIATAQLLDCERSDQRDPDDLFHAELPLEPPKKEDDEQSPDGGRRDGKGRSKSKAGGRQ